MTSPTKPSAIAHVLYSFDEIGGLENGVINLLNNLPSDQSRHIICALTKTGSLEDRVKIKNVHYYSLNKREGNDLTLPLRLWKIFRDEQVDVVHLRNWVTMVEGYLAARLAHVNRVIYSEHGRHFEDLEEGKRINTLIKKYIFKKVDYLLAVSNQLGTEMTYRYGLERDIRVISNGVDTNRFCPMTRSVTRKQLGLNENEPVIGTVSRLDKVKNLDRFLNVSIKGQFPAKIVIAGDGPEKDRLSQIVNEYDAMGQVMLLGNRSDIPIILNCLDVFILPSQSEGMSNVLLEAMSCGLPVVAFDVGGNRELIDDRLGGFLIEPGDFDIFLQALRKLIDSPGLRADMGVYNNRKIIDNFSIHKMVKSYADLYNISIINSINMKLTN